MYLIIIKNGHVSVKKYSNSDEFEMLTKNGEEQFQYSPDSFFDWFIDTIAYSSESLSFLVFSDDENLSFNIPEKIVPDEKNNFDNLDFPIRTIKNLKFALAIPPIDSFKEAFDEQNHFLPKTLREKKIVRQADHSVSYDSSEKDTKDDSGLKTKRTFQEYCKKVTAKYMNSNK